MTTKREELEAEVIEMRRPIVVKLLMPDDTTQEVTVKPLGWEDIGQIASMFAAFGRTLVAFIARVQAVGGELSTLGAADTSRSTSGEVPVEGDTTPEVGDPPAAFEELEAAIIEAAGHILDETMIKKVLLGSRDLVKELVKIGTDVEWEVVESDYIASAELAMKVLSQNLGPRLRDFFSGEAVETLRMFGVPVGFGAKPSSSATDTMPPTSEPGPSGN